jgi:hypothetical protein
MHDFANRGEPNMKKTGLMLAALCVCALMLVVVAVQAAPDANVAGTWTLTMAPPAGGGGGGNGGGGGGGNGGGGGTPPPPPTVTFKQDGTALSGTQSGRGGDTAITGSVAGNKVTWTVKRNMRGTDVTFTYTATVDGNKMTGTQTSDIPNSTARDFTATKN